MRYYYTTFIVLASLFAFGCQSSDIDASYPESQDKQRKMRRGKLTGEDGLVIFGRKSSEEDSSGHAGIGINSFLWKATLDTLSFMPLADVDPFGGVIITDWYEDPKAKGERFKVNVLIFGKSLASNALKVTVFKQNYNKSQWRDATTNEKVARDLENKILTRARELRVESL